MSVFWTDWPPEIAAIVKGNVTIAETQYQPGASTLQVFADAAESEFPAVVTVYAEAPEAPDPDQEPEPEQPAGEDGDESDNPAVVPK